MPSVSGAPAIFTPLEDGGNPFDIPEALMCWIEDHVDRALSTGFIPATLADTEEAAANSKQVLLLTAIGSMDYLVHCRHLRKVTLQWSTIQRDAKASGYAYKYTLPGRGVASFEPLEIDIWKFRPDEDGMSVLERRVEQLGEYGLDSAEEAIGMEVLRAMLRARSTDIIQSSRANLQSHELHRLVDEDVRKYDRLLQVVLWSTIMWTISDLGWDYITEIPPGAAEPRAIVPWGLKNLQQPQWVDIPIAPTLSRGQAIDSGDSDIVHFGRLLKPEMMQPTGTSVTCYACNVEAHCLVRLDIANPDKTAGSSNWIRVHLCAHCRELAIHNKWVADEDEHMPHEYGGQGSFNDWEGMCLRHGQVFRPYCEGTPECKHNHQDHMMAVLEEQEAALAKGRLQQLQDGTNPAMIEYYRRVRELGG